MSAFYDQASLVVVPSGYKSGKIYAQKPLTTDGQLTFTRASTATRVNASGLIETVASGVPRLDYTNSTCPKLLLEPQRTNYLINSNTVGGTGWSYGAPVTVTENYATSPAGTQTASRIQWDGTNAELYQYTGQPSTRSSVYIKGTAGQVVSFCLTQITLTGQWQRIQANSLIDGSNTWWGIILRNDTGHTATDFLLWGAQAEVGSYITSLIPTTSAAVTRLADFAKKENIGGTLPTAYPFTLYSESDFYLGSDDFGLSMIDIGTTNIYYTFGTYSNKYIGVARGSAGEIVATSTVNYTPGLNKMAVVFTSSSIKVFANGALVATATNTLAFNAGVNDLIVGTLREAGDIGTRNSLKQALVFKSALTDAQCVELTTL